MFGTKVALPSGLKLFSLNGPSTMLHSGELAQRDTALDWLSR